MKATIIDTHHTVQIEETQVDIFYNFYNATITIFLDGDYYVCAHFAPARQILNYTNVLEVATVYYDHWKKRKIKKELEDLKELNR